MEEALGISLYSYLYLKLAKMLCLSYYCLCFFFNKIGEPEGGKGSAWKFRGGWWWWYVAQTKYIPVTKCKNNKIKIKNQKKNK
jgi:hypothetical protein